MAVKRFVTGCRLALFQRVDSTVTFMGRRPNPTERLTTGDDGAESVSRTWGVEEPAWAILAAPVYAEGVAALAAEKWAELSDVMAELGTIGPENAPALEMLCVFYARWRLAEAEVARVGPIVKAPVTGVPMHNPFLSVANGAADRFLRLAAELGLTPAMRGRVGKRPLGSANARTKPKQL
ncbi:MAG: P27 family phage terminase small subunit [Janthinobacterium lividum]